MWTKEIVILGCILFSLSVPAEAQKTIEGEKSNSNAIGVDNFPSPTSSQRRIVIYLPEKSTSQEEKNYKVELISGKKMMVDCNLHGLAGNIEEKTIEGMGIKFYTLNTTGKIWGTRMGCPDNSKHEEFVTAKSLMVDYNSRIPLVVYAPLEYEVRYRIWEAGKMIIPEAQLVGSKEKSESLYGKWKWLSSSGEYTGKEVALKNVGLSKIYSFKKDGSYLQYKKGRMASAGKYKLTNGTSVFIKGILPMLELAGNHKKMSYSFNGRDTLILTEECIDCYRHIYVRKK